jgi:hypothetical protein
LNTFASSSVVGALLWQASGCCLDYPGGCSPSWRSRRCTGCAESRRPLRLGGTPARALCSSSRYRISGASIFQSHKIASNTASGGPSHHAKISHGGCGFHSGLGRTLRARISIPSLQDGSSGRRGAPLCQFDAPVFRSDSTLRGRHPPRNNYKCLRNNKFPFGKPRRPAVAEEDWGRMKIGNPPGAQFEILVDGEARSYRDTKSGASGRPASLFSHYVFA